MQRAAYDVTTVGNAIIDILHPVEEATLVEHAIQRAGMTLIDEERALYLTALFENATVAAGGSVANSAAGVASLGGKAGFIGLVADDALGEAYAQSFRAVGATFDTPPRKGPPGTARSIILVTPDGQRSMNTYLGASTLLAPQHIDAALIQASAIILLEGYLFDKDEAKAAFIHAAEIARSAGRKVSISLSDSFCVDRHRASFRHLVANHVDILICNEAEILSLYEVDDFDTALAHARQDCAVIAATRSEKGSVVVAHGEQHAIKAAPVARVMDTTGAGDQYAAGFLYGLAAGKPLAACGALGALAAAEVISHMGPRPETSLRALADRAGL
ncbi:MAG: adenosine kinase [Hyphomonadaceae bacterium]